MSTESIAWKPKRRSPDQQNVYNWANALIEHPTLQDDIRRCQEAVLVRNKGISPFEERPSHVNTKRKAMGFDPCRTQDFILGLPGPLRPDAASHPALGPARRRRSLTGRQHNRGKTPGGVPRSVGSRSLPCAARAARGTMSPRRWG